jgi:xylulokinase
VGGVAKSEYWVKIFADVTGFSMKRLTNDVEAPFGDAFLAGLGTKVIDKPERIKEWVKFRTEIEPDEKNKTVYEKYYEIYKELYDKTKETMEKSSSIFDQN